ncbi:hypothetical protein GETHOR_09010 [Geothrix oryzae]|uniref:Isoprenylcysteine carboxylmethyltransferase family protein n=1 Tax=Geothrix oryzae TaxID=2927975 RepID=A0ABM8DPA0_9BACT|nr:isoprenylcysteine carboxylmethyltransferase family protein [Geothrix oryzae]BDU68800.1 hypothetical protein GETHOR_09010 [Geothrix oryzae]
MPEHQRSPQPPLLFLACLLAGWGLGFLRPLGTHLPDALRHGVGVALLAGSLALAGWALAAFKGAGTTPNPNGEATALLTSGPFGYSRNPLYLGLSACLAGLGMLLDSAWVLLMVSGLVLLLDRLVIAREEVRLRAQFGGAYEAYVRRVRRWA